ncbi:MAG: hypothetical protein QME47_01650 [Candidatus Thermoplasmatota archaeon]|nr:hypothetical protein [Candidatus Thermoplasmatota archaeon]
MKSLVQQARELALKCQYDKAIGMLQPLLNSNKPEEKLEAEYQISYIYVLMGEWDKGEEKLKSVIEESLSCGLTEIAGKCYVELGRIYERRGKILDAIEHYRKGLKIFKETENLFEQARTLNNIGALYGELYYQEEATIYFSQALAIAQTLNDKRLLAYTNINMASKFLKFNQAKDAESHLVEAFRLFRELGEVKMFAPCYYFLSKFYYLTGDERMREKMSSKAIKLAEENNDKYVLSIIYEFLVEVYEKAGEKIKTRENLIKAIEYNKALKNERRVAELEKKLIELNYMAGKPIV